MSLSIETDIIIVGTGLVGLAAALALTQQGKRVVLVGNMDGFNKTSAWDKRIYAMTPANVAWLQALGVWQHVDEARVQPMQSMRLWHHEVELQLRDQDAHVPNLGVIIESQNLQFAILKSLKTTGLQANIHAACRRVEITDDVLNLHLDNGDTLNAQLLVGADGAKSWVRERLNMPVKTRDFAQTALVANFKAEKPHHGAAFQWFKPHETLALLPLPDGHVSLVWSMPNNQAHDFKQKGTHALAHAVAKSTQYVLGALELVSDSLSFALMQQTVVSAVSEKVVLIGDAAHQIHPMAGQGMNLGLRDVVELVRILGDAHGLQSLGDAQLLRQYARGRRTDVASMHILTGGLDAWFATQLPGAQRLAQWGFKQVSSQAWLKNFLIKQAVA